MTAPTWITSAGFLFTATELISTSVAILSTGSNISYKLLNGELPEGLSISTSSGIISGAPLPVINITNKKFVIRISNDSGVKDRTFNIDVIGSDKPEWKNITLTTGSVSTIVTSTSEGYIYFDDEIKPYVFNRQYINYQFEAVPKEAPDSTKIKYFIQNNDGILPPNLTLSETGNLNGIIDCFTDSDLNTSSNITTTVYIPKTYQFYVSASDDIAVEKRLFKILVVDSELLRYDDLTTSTGINILDISFNTQEKNYLQKPQFINGNDLGTVRAENYNILPVTVYDPSPFIGTITYSLVTGTSILNNIPNDLTFDTQNGIIYGYIPYQPAYTKNYNITVKATKSDFDTGVSVTASNTFTLAVKGMVESSIKWVTTNTFLGTLTTGELSHISVEATQINSDYDIKYLQSSGSLPNGITLLSDGSISGKPSSNTSGTYTFNVIAKDIYELSAIEKTFSLDVKNSDKEFTSIYFRPFLSKTSNDYYQNFINNETIFDPNLMYRYLDPEFGVQRQIKIVLEFAIEQTNLRKYATALSTNFYKRSFYFGNFKTAKAENSDGTYIYDIVYADVIDNLINFNNTSVNQIVYFNEIPYYPASIDNMRLKLEDIVLDDLSKIQVNKQFYPKFLKTSQNEEYKSIEYLRFIPICYTLPNQGIRILNRLKLANVSLKNIHLDIDRIIIKEYGSEKEEKYLFFSRRDVKN
jgi:FlaG/FlaF family flagellin (archaellin)